MRNYRSGCERSHHLLPPVAGEVTDGADSKKAFPIRSSVKAVVKIFRPNPNENSRAAWTAGKINANKIPMMAITTSTSINVNPRRDSDCPR